MATQLEVTQIRGNAGMVETQRVILQGLGLRGVNRKVVVANTPSFRGMIKKVLHLVTVREVEAAPVAKAAAASKGKKS